MKTIAFRAFQRTIASRRLLKEYSAFNATIHEA